MTMQHGDRAMPRIRAVVFDLDGLMLNTEDIFDLAGRELLARRGLEMTSEIHHSMLGRRPDEAFQALKDLTGISDAISDLKLETRELFASIAEHHLAVMPGLTDLLDYIEDLQLPRAVATSSPRDYMQDLLSRFGLLHRFHLTLTAEDVTHGKPHPEIYLTAAARLSVDPSEVLVLEDSETGTRAAAAAGTYAVSVPNRHTAAGNFEIADAVVSSLADPLLRRILNRR
ncbi:MAG: HAD family phosphatase [Planctomycetaceae bacterium]